MRSEDLDTPALLVDIDALDRNLRKMNDITAETGTMLRPHFKVHKCLPIVERQLRLGAIGITCAKLSEAEALVDHGIDRILIANEIAGQPKIGTLLNLRKRADVMVGVDSLCVAECMAAEAEGAKVTMPVLIEVDLGMERCGVTPEGTVALAEKLTRMKGIEFRGLMGYEGHLIALPEGEEKTKAIFEALDRFTFVKSELETKGVEVSIVSAGGTGSYSLAASHPIVTELQVGTYAVMDTLYGGFTKDFELATTILCTIISRPTRDRLILDVGRKGVNTQLNLSGLKNRPKVFLRMTYAEHGEMRCEEEAPDLKPGVKVELDMPYACGSIHLYEKMHLVRNGEVVDVWPILGRGKIQ